VGEAVRLVVAGGNPAVTEGLGVILDAEADFTVCGVAHDGRGVVELAAAHRPGVLLLDPHLPGGDPAQTPADIKAASPATKVLLLALNGNGAVIASGADGVVPTGASSRQLADGIRRLADGKPAMVAASRRPPPAPPASSCCGCGRCRTGSGRSSACSSAAGPTGASPRSGT
jgi:DNA-binding NarL/FixJ family response regulator